MSNEATKPKTSYCYLRQRLLSKDAVTNKGNIGWHRIAAVIFEEIDQDTVRGVVKFAFSKLKAHRQPKYLLETARGQLNSVKHRFELPKKDIKLATILNVAGVKKLVDQHYPVLHKKMTSKRNEQILRGALLELEQKSKTV